MAVGNANTDIADYLRDMLPDKHLEQQHSCKKRGGFERAGRWMRLSRASGYLQDLVSCYLAGGQEKKIAHECQG